MTAFGDQPPMLRLARHRYTVLLVLLLAGLIVQSFEAGRIGTRGVHDVLGTLITVTTFAVVFRSGALRMPALATMVALVAIRWSRFLVPAEYNHALFVLFEALEVAFLSAAVWQILHDLFATPVNGAEDVRGAICGYLLGGAAWTGVNALTWLLVPSAYALDPGVVGLTSDWSGTAALFSYYSFTQVLTLGYSDVTPVRAPATTWSLFAALFGMFYTAVVVSQLVGLARTSRTDA
jgi:hypothetical protein